LASFKSYLNNNAPFINARNKWQSAAGVRATAEAKWKDAKETDKNYQQLLAAFKSAQEQEAAAKAAKDAAESNARAAYDKIENDKKAAEQKKKDSVTQRAIDTVQAEVDKYKNAGLSVPADKQAKLDELKGKLSGGPTGPTGPTTATGPTGPTSTTTGPTGQTGGVSLDDFLKNLDGNPSAINQVKAYLGITKLDGVLDYETISKIIAKEKEIEILSDIRGPIDRLTYYAQTKSAGTGGTTTTATISSRSDATVYINNALKRAGIDREATPEEIDNLTKILNDAEGRFRTTKSGGVTKDLLGDRTQFIANLITTGKYVDPNTGKPIKGLKEDVKLAAGVLGNLSKSAQSLKADTRSLSVQTLQSTANANGVKLSPEQLNQYALDIQNGKDVKVIQAQIRNLAGIGMPDSVKKLLAEGTDLETIYSPYKQTMAAVLELNPTTINFNDPVLRSAIGPNGEVPLYEFQKALRKDARWQYTNNAREDVFQSVSKVLQDFGFQG